MTFDNRTLEERLRDAGLLPTEQRTSVVAMPVNGMTSNGYLDRALAGEVQKVRDAQEGRRNATLNTSAFSLGQLVAGAGLDRNLVVEQLTLAALQVGLGEKETENTIQSGLSAGANEPRGIPELRPVQVLTIAPFEDIVDPAEISAHIRDQFPLLDWKELWANEIKEEWIVEPILPARRLVALYSQPKVGKSLLMLELAAAVASGRPIFGTTPTPRKVLYVDFENDPQADIRTRLTAMGYAPDDLDNLCYLSFPTLAGLDSDRGGNELVAVTKEYGCEVVVIDTVSRAVAGEENDNDTWLAFYRHTGLKLKRAEIALIRLDHAGKDETKGQRGGSAKRGDVDAVWRMSKLNEETYRLDCEDHRMPVAEGRLILTRTLSPLQHTVTAGGGRRAFDASVTDAVAALDAESADLEIGRVRARGVLQTLGVKCSNEALEEAIRRRKSRLLAIDEEVS